MPVFDIHHHAGKFLLLADAREPGSLSSSSWIDDDYQARVKLMEANGIDTAAVMPAPSYFRPNGLTDTMEINDAMGAYKKLDPERFPIALGTVEPLYGEASIPELERIKRELKLDGVMFHHRLQGVFIDHWIMRPYLRKIRELELMPFVHVMAGSEMEKPWRLQILAEEFPDITFIGLDAFTSFYQTDEIIHIAKHTPNIYWDTASMWHGTQAVSRFVSQVGADRVLFGSNMYAIPPSFERSESLASVQEAAITQTDRSKVFWDNAKQLFNL